MVRLLQELHEWARKQDEQVFVNLLDRFMEKINKGEIIENDLPILNLYQTITRSVSKKNETNRLFLHFLLLLDNYESRKIAQALHFEVLRRHELLSRMKAEKIESIRRNDAVGFLQIDRDIELLNQAPEATRQIDQETVDLAIKALRLKEKHRWSYLRVSSELFGDPSRADQIKKAVQRAREAGKLAK